ncbi:MAG: hypothetical protein R2759_19580 [Bacteroidales bacterium]
MIRFFHAKRSRKGFHAEIAKGLRKVASEIIHRAPGVLLRALRKMIYSDSVQLIFHSGFDKVSRRDRKGFSRRDRKGFTRKGCTEIIHRVLGVFLACFAKIIYSEMMIDFSLKDLLRISRKDRKVHAEIAKVCYDKVAAKLFIACLAFFLGDTARNNLF